MFWMKNGIINLAYNISVDNKKWYIIQILIKMDIPFRLDKSQVALKSLWLGDFFSKIYF